MDPSSGCPLSLDVSFCNTGQDDLGVACGSRKWKGTLKARMPISASRVWEVVSDFVAVANWGLLADSSLVDGEPNVPGCIRYCKSRHCGPDGKTLWATEKLLANDHEKLIQSYSVIDGNVGLNGYVATFSISECGADDCSIEWFFEFDPLQGKEEQQVVKQITSVLASRLNRLYELLSKSNQANL
ncbi:hypothetical protein KP509_02G104400 [Ceratopteris richardii]|uniref:Lachrymatory-factor synthase n=1 Tax=Ceratopteris richardii TaxID=49495 RepID=A0A8T2V9B3_CERRI|nr:hypothetical protein KP509_02G104400 [Ceratopteris richardii]